MLVPGKAFYVVQHVAYKHAGMHFSNKCPTFYTVSIDAPVCVYISLPYRAQFKLSVPNP
jgi:hypothetical protein